VSGSEIWFGGIVTLLVIGVVGYFYAVNAWCQRIELDQFLEDLKAPDLERNRLLALVEAYESKRKARQTRFQLPEKRRVA
jgi:hypothetical protein